MASVGVGELPTSCSTRERDGNKATWGNVVCALTVPILVASIFGVSLLCPTHILPGSLLLGGDTARESSATNVNKSVFPDLSASSGAAPSMSLANVTNNAHSNFSAAKLHQLLVNGNRMPLVGLGVGNLDRLHVVDHIRNAVENFNVRLIDTSAFSGNEDLVATALNAAKLGAEVEIITKVWYTHLGYERTMMSVQDSLAKLGPDRAVSILLQWPRCLDGTAWMECEEEEDALPERVKEAGPAPHLNPVSWMDSWRALEELYLNGSIKNIGVSNFGAHDMQDLFEFASVSPHIYQGNVWNFVSDPELIKQLASHDVTFQAYNVMRAAFAESTHGTTHRDALQNVAVEIGASESEVLLGWLVAQGVGVIPEASNPKQVRSNSPRSVEAATKVSPAQFARIAAAAEGILKASANANSQSWRPERPVANPWKESTHAALSFSPASPSSLPHTKASPARDADDGPSKTSAAAGSKGLKPERPIADPGKEGAPATAPPSSASPSLLLSTTASLAAGLRSATDKVRDQSAQEAAPQPVSDSILREGMVLYSKGHSEPKPDTKLTQDKGTMLLELTSASSLAHLNPLQVMSLRRSHESQEVEPTRKSGLEEQVPEALLAEESSRFDRIKAAAKQINVTEKEINVKRVASLTPKVPAKNSVSELKPASDGSLAVKITNMGTSVVQLFWVNQRTSAENAVTHPMSKGDSTGFSSYVGHKFAARYLDGTLAAEFEVSNGDDSPEFLIHDETSF